MKLIFTIILYLVGTVIVTTSSVNAELRGVAESASASASASELESSPQRKLAFPPFTPPAPVSDPQCTPIGQDPYLTDEYVAFQWNLTSPTGTYLPDDYWPLDCTDSSDKSTLESTFVSAYNLAVGDCAQVGAFHVVTNAELENCDQDSGTYYLHIRTYSNSAKERAAVVPDSNNCGVVVYNDTDEALDSDWDYDIVDDISERRRRRRTQDAPCDCPGPKASDLIVQYNAALVTAIDNPEFSTYINDTQQLCIVPPVIELVSSIAPSDSPTKRSSTPRPTPNPTRRRPTRRPNRTPRPNRRPTRRPNPTPQPTPDNTPVPTITNDPNTTPQPTPDNTPVPTNDPDTTPQPTPETPAPVATTQPAGNYSNYDRFLVWDGEHMVVEEVGGTKEVGVGAVGISQEPFAYDQEHKICQEVDAKLIDNYENRKLCQMYLDLPYIRTTTEEDADGSSSCPNNEAIVPKTYFSVSKSNEQSHEQLGIALSNPSYERKHYGDKEAHEFVKENCGIVVGNAYECLAPPAYRADLFRFCALYTYGGLYMDSDMIPLVPLEELYDPCSVATVGHDWPQGKPQKQMKILAGQAGAPIFLCMINKIVTSVRSRHYPENPLALTGPMALHECYDEYSMDVSITYHDTRDAAYPYSGMRSVGNKLIAFESPNNHNDKNYKIDFDLHEVYRPTCPLHKKNVNPVKISNA